jgi:hypothetical protein
MRRLSSRPAEGDCCVRSPGGDGAAFARDGAARDGARQRVAGDGGFSRIGVVFHQDSDGAS